MIPLEREDGVKYVTNSEIATWKRCPRKWWLAYYRRLGFPERDFGKPSGLGTRVHEALRILYAPPTEEQQSPSDEEVIAFVKNGIEEDLAKYPAQEPEIKKEGELALIMIEGYLEWLAESGADEQLRVIEPEQGVAVPLLDKTQAPIAPYERVDLLAKLDVRTLNERDESRWALEHKTVQSLKDVLPRLQINAQLLTEHLVEFMKLREEGHAEQTADGVLYNMLRKVKRTARSKPPYYDRVPVRHNIEELRHQWEKVVSWTLKILDAERRLNAGEDHHYVVPNIDTRDCTWDCPFFRICAMFDDGSDVEAAIEDLYVQVDPLARYSETDEEDVKES